MTEEDIKALVSEHAEVKLVSLPRDKLTNNPRGFCFVDVESDEQANIAVAALDGSVAAGRNIRVTKSVPKDQIEKKPVVRGADIPQVPEGYGKIYVANLPYDATKEDLTETFGKFGEVTEVYVPMNRLKGINKGFAFITMKEEDIASTIEKASGMEFMGRELNVSLPLPPGEKASKPRGVVNNNLVKLYVGNLSFYTIEETLKDLFEEFGPVSDCYLPKDVERGGDSSRGFGFVTMEREAATAAMNELNGCEIDGRSIQVNIAQAKTRN
jgi:RNA recognition motif-containing protein